MQALLKEKDRVIKTGRNKRSSTKSNSEKLANKNIVGASIQRGEELFVGDYVHNPALYSRLLSFMHSNNDRVININSGSDSSSRDVCNDLLMAYAEKYFYPHNSYFLNGELPFFKECFESNILIDSIQASRISSKGERCLLIIENFPCKPKKMMRHLYFNICELLNSGWTIIIISEKPHMGFTEYLDDVVEISPELIKRTIATENDIISLKNKTAHKTTAKRNQSNEDSPKINAQILEPENSLTLDRNKAAELQKRNMLIALYPAKIEPNQDTSQVFVKLFGGFGVFKNGVSIPNRCWGKAKARLLFTYLVARQGRETSREEIIREFWPEMDRKRATDNLYVVWSSIKSALADSDGECPYVSSHGNLYRIEPSLVKSDVFQFELITRQILLGKPEEAKLFKFFINLDGLYSGDLLGGAECPVNALNRLGKKYRDTIIDSHVFATELMLKRGNISAALWFARKALEIDSKREDVYRVLMEAQSASGQRTCAIETYFMCKSYLDEELGLTLSKKTINMYEKIIKGDDC